MSHVDEGALHAFLDGALDALPQGEAERIRAHLGSCDACARRLEEERALREEAAAILSGVDPGVGDMPSLEELRRRAAAGAPVPSHPAVRLRRVSWAASVAVALGAGWLLRGATTPTMRSDFSDVSSTREAAVSAEEAPVGAPPAEASADGALSGGSLAEGSGSARRPSALVADAERPDRDAAVGSSGAAVPQSPLPTNRATEARETSVVAELEIDPLIGQRADSGQRGLGFEQALRRRQEGVRVLDLLGDSSNTRIAPAASMPVQAAKSVVAEDAAASLAERLDEPGVPEPQLPMTSERGLPASLAVPGLTVVSVTWLDGAAGAVRVLQLLESGDTLELVHLPAGADPADVAPVAADGRLQLVRPRDGGWLVARAQLSREALEVLLGRLGRSR